jgi:hypothetical protein
MFKKNSENLNVRVNLGGTALNMSDKVIEAEMKIMEYRNTIVNQNEKIRFLEIDKEKLILEIEENKKEINSLKEIIRKKNEEINQENYKKEISNKENLLREKKLNENYEIINLQKNEINELNFRLSEYEKNNIRFNKEIIESEKIKDIYEKDLVNYLDVNTKMNDKIRMLEHVLVQKDKYVQLLLKKKDLKNENINNYNKSPNFDFENLNNLKNNNNNKKFEIGKRDSKILLLYFK